MFTFMAEISQFERDLISQRTKEGLDAARSRGKKVEENLSLMVIKRRLYII